MREIRLVRREGRSSVCLVLLRFDMQPSADGFYRDFNGRPVREDTAVWGYCSWGSWGLLP